MRRWAYGGIGAGKSTGLRRCQEREGQAGWRGVHQRRPFRACASGYTLPFSGEFELERSPAKRIVFILFQRGYRVEFVGNARIGKPLGNAGPPYANIMGRYVLERNAETILKVADVRCRCRLWGTSIRDAGDRQAGRRSGGDARSVRRTRSDGRRNRGSGRNGHDRERFYRLAVSLMPVEETQYSRSKRGTADNVSMHDALRALPRISRFDRP